MRTLCLKSLVSVVHTTGAMRLGAIILIITAGLKIGAVFELPMLALVHDPVFPMLDERTVLVGTAALEILVAVVILLRPMGRPAACSLAFLTGCFCLYRLGLHLVGYTGGCLCLGKPVAFTTFTKNLDWVVLFLLFYLIAISVVALVAHYRSAIIAPVADYSHNTTKPAEPI